MEIKATYTNKELLDIQPDQMRNYIRNREQANYWVELTTKDYPINRPKKDKDGNIIGKVEKRLTFEGARLRYFKRFYKVEKEPRPFEKEALSIQSMFA